MRRFFLTAAQFQAGQTVDLSPEVIKHALNVLRLAPGAEIELLDGRGTIARCRLKQLQAKTGKAEVLALRNVPPPPLRVELIQGTAKGDKLDLVLQKGTELGVNHFIICPTERSIGRFKQDRLPAKSERWQRIVQEAARQCGQSYLPTLTITKSLSDALSVCSGDQRLVLWEEAEVPLPNLLAEQKPAAISLLVGPEGGLTKDEVTLAHSSGFNNVRLGPRILRTETAGLAIVSILQYLYGDLASADRGV